jgi:hypothetical protein
MVYYPTHPLVLTHSKLKLSVMVASLALRYRASLDFANLLKMFVCWIKQPTSQCPCYVYVIVPMAPMVRIEPNGLQALLSHDDVVGDIVA